MKRLTLCAILFVVASVLVADVCWGNGTPLYQGDYINYTSQIVAEDNAIYVLWTQKHQEVHKLMMHKVDYQGNPLWTEAVTIDQSGEYIGGSIEVAACGCVFVTAHRYETSGYMMYKLDADGNVIWQHQFDYTISQVLALNDGGIIYFSQHNPVHATWIANDGTIVWNNTVLSQTNGDVGCALAEFINGKIHIIDQDNEYIRLISYNQDGSLHLASPQYTFSVYGSVKSMNGNVYAFFEKDLQIKMWMLDTNGYSLTGVDPISLFGCAHYTRVACLDGDDGFSLVQEYPDDDIHLWMYAYDGTLLHSETYGNGNTLIRKACDQDVDFVSALYYQDDHEHNLILPISTNGFDDPIVLQDFPAGIVSGMHSIQNGFTWVGLQNRGSRALSVARIEDGTVSMNTLCANDNDSIHPQLVKSDDGLNVYWYSASHDSLMMQQYNENGQPQLEVNGAGILPGGENYYVDDQIILTYDITESADEILIKIKAFIPDGSPCWEYEYGLDYADITSAEIVPFYDGYIFCGAGTDYGVSDLIFIKLMPSGPAWSEPIIHPLPWGTYGLHVQGNLLFYTVYPANKYMCAINDDGSLQQEVFLGNSFNDRYLGNEVDFFVVCPATEVYDIYYFHEGEMVWQTPLTVDAVSYNDLQVSFVNGTVTIAGFGHYSTVHVATYDLQQNSIPSRSFIYNALHYEINDLTMICSDDAVVLCFASREFGDETQFTYAVFAPDGTVLQPETAEPLMDRDYMARIHDVVFTDDSIYLALSCELYIGDYWDECDFYMQKVDIASIVGASPHIAPSVQDGCTLQAYPNPFNPSTKISFSLSQDAHTEIIIFNCRGQRVQTLLNDACEAGSYSVEWMGRDAADNPVSSGVYFYQLIVNGHTELTKKAILLK
jgi:outer membrane protein assembly factor BamB